MLCRACLVDSHSRLPFHRVQVRFLCSCALHGLPLILLTQHWTGDYFERATLKQLGAVLPLLHGGEQCPSGLPNPSTLTVFHCNRFHTVSVAYCNCPGAPLAPAQLPRSCLWPGTQDVPHTAGTFDLLRLFQTADHRAHVNVTDMYRVLELMTDGYGLEALPVRPILGRCVPVLTYSQDSVDQLRVMVRQWRVTKMFRHAGRFLQPGGVAATARGELAIPCHACPDPARNLPNSWRADEALLYGPPYYSAVTRTDPFLSWMYILFVAMDGNFKQSNFFCKDGWRDLPLLAGLAYMINPTPFNRWVLAHTNDVDVSGWSSFSWRIH
jgi:hypothetical protein